MRAKISAQVPRVARIGQGAALAVLLAGGFGGGARAQGSYIVPNLPLDVDRGRNVGVLDRPRPEYEALGVVAGGFMLRPRVELSTIVSDNVYQTPERRGDYAVSVAPSLRAVSNWNLHSLEFSGGGDVRRYFAASRRDVANWNAGVNGRYDISGAGAIAGGLSAAQSVEPATSASYPGAAAEPSQYQTFRAQVIPRYASGQFKAQVGYTFSALAFDNVRSFSGAMLDQQYRNSQTHSVSGRGEYAITPDTSVFVQGDYDAVSYLHALSNGADNRDSKTYTAMAGASFDVTALLRGSIGLGYTSRHYRSALYPDVSGLAAEVKLDWFPDTLTTLGLTGRRIVQDGVIPNLGGLVNNSVALRVDHEFLRDFLVNVQGAYEYDKFQNSTASIDILRFGGGARWLLSREVELGVSLTRDSRKPHGVTGLVGYAETRGAFSVTLQK
jgi:hypothetical protein